MPLATTAYVPHLARQGREVRSHYALSLLPLSPILTKSVQLAQLERQLSATAARAAHLQRRLFLTLDALDAAQHCHKLELEEEALSKDELRRLYARQVETTRAIEAERDELRSAATNWLNRGKLSIPSPTHVKLLDACSLYRFRRACSGCIHWNPLQGGIPIG